MIKCFFNSIGRTLGRIFAYFLVGIGLIYIGKMFGLNLGLITLVSAKQDLTYIGGGASYTIPSGWNLLADKNSMANFELKTPNSTGDPEFINNRLNNPNINRADYIYFNIMLSYYNSLGNRVAITNGANTTIWDNYLSSNFYLISSLSGHTYASTCKIVGQVNDAFTIQCPLINNQSPVGLGFNYKINETGNDQLSFEKIRFSVSHYVTHSTDSQQDINQSIKDQTNEIIESNKKQDETNNKLDNIFGDITSDKKTDISGLNNDTVAGWLPPGPLDSILNLPLTLFKNVSNNLSKTCKPFTFKLPFVDSSLQLPCIVSFYDKIGATTFLELVGSIASAFILYYYFLHLYNWFHKLELLDGNVKVGGL